MVAPTPVEVSAISTLPVDLAKMVDESVVEGFQFLIRLQDDWESGANRFSGKNEIFFAAHVENELAGVGGLNQDPFTKSDKIGRLRRFYVLNRYRRAGVGSALLECSMSFSRCRFQAVRLRTDSAEATLFYESAGFEPISGDSNATHEIRVAQSPAV